MTGIPQAEAYVVGRDLRERAGLLHSQGAWTWTSSYKVSYGGVLCDAPVSAHLVPGQTWRVMFFSEKLRKEPLCIQRYLDSAE